MIGLSLGNLWVHLGLNATQYMAQIQAAELRMAAAGKKMQAIGRSMTMKVTAPIIGVGGASVLAFGKFDSAMTKSVAIMSDVTKEIRKEMERTALELSGRSTKSATDLAKSYFYLASAGFSAKQSIAALPAVEAFAVAGAFDMAKATDLLTDAHSALGLSVDDVSENMKNMIKVGDILVAANTLANASTEQFAQALTTEAGAAIKEYNLDLHESVGVLAAYADQGIKAAHAGSMFSRMTRLMIKGFNDNRAAWNRFNVTIEKDSTGALRAFADIFRDLNDEIGYLGATQKAAALELLGFQARSQQAVLPLLRLGDSIEVYGEKLRELEGIQDKIRAIQMTSFAAQMKTVWNQLTNMAISIGGIVAPSIEKLGKSFAKMSKWWSGLNENTQKFYVNIALSAAALGPLTWMIGKTITGLIALKGALLATAATASMTGGVLVGLAGIMAGYSIGKWAQQESEDAALAYEELAFAISKGLAYLERAWNDFGVTMKWVFGGAFRWIKNEFSELMMSIAKGLYSLEKLTGLEYDSGLLANYAVELKNSVLNASKDMEKERLKIEQEYLDQVKYITQEHEVKMDLIRKSFRDKRGAKQDRMAELKALEEEEAAMKAQVEQAREKLQLSGRNLDTIEDMTSALEAELELIGLTNDERQRAVRLTKFRNALQEEYNKGTAEYEKHMEYYLELLDKIGEKQRQIEKSQALSRWAEDAANVWGNISQVTADGLTSLSESFAAFFSGQKVDWKRWSAAILSDILAVIIRLQMLKIWQTVTGMFGGGGLGGAFGAGRGATPGMQGPSVQAALGKVFNKGQVVPMRLGGIYNNPTLMPMKGQKTALIAEKEPEAAMPLTRDKYGRLSVHTEGSQSPPVVNLRNINVFDQSEIVAAMASEAGEEVTLNILRKNGVV
jgi:TP901 family phage tail tape measure protein/lambda family phage tail tape measure protein